MKISYHACEKQISILELMLNAIIDAYKAYQKRMEEDMDNYKREVSPHITDYNSEEKSSINQFYKKKSSLKSEKVRNYIAICNSFQPLLKGISKLQSIRARSIYERMKFENFISFDWEYGQNPCLKMPKILQITSYPHSYRYYDPVPKIISRYIADKTFKNFLENKMGGTFRQKPNSLIELAR